MRDIKFRVWNKDWKMMCSPKDVLSINFCGVTGCATDVEFSITTNDGVRNDQIWEDCETGDLVFMQYTGFKKDEIELYEGDIIEEDNLIKIIEFSKGGWFVNCPDSFRDSYFLYHIVHDLDSVKILGNIYSNPELLNTQQRGGKE